jgi:hypothetical protein
MIRYVHSESRIRILIFTHPESRIQGSKRHQIPYTQHCDQGSEFVSLTAKGLDPDRKEWLQM